MYFIYNGEKGYQKLMTKVPSGNIFSSVAFYMLSIINLKKNTQLDGTISLKYKKSKGYTKS